MKRVVHRAVVVSENGNKIIGEREAYAWNSAIRASEAIVREYAREAFRGAFEGARPVVLDAEANGDAATGRIYRRVWTGPSGETLRAIVWAVS